MVEEGGKERRMMENGGEGRESGKIRWNVDRGERDRGKRIWKGDRKG